MFACQLPGRRACNRSLPPIDLTVRYGADIISCFRDNQRLDRLPRGACADGQRSKEAATVRRSVPGARRRGPRARRFSVDGAQIDINLAATHRSTPTGSSAACERPNGRGVRDRAPSWQPRGRARAAAAHERPSPSTQQKRSAVAVRPRPFAGPRPNHEAIAGWSARPSSRTPT